MTGGKTIICQDCGREFSAGPGEKQQNFSLGKNNSQNISKPVKKGLAFFV